MKRYSQLRATLAIARASFASIMRSPSAVVFSIGFPLIFILVFGFIGGGGFSIDVAVEPKCDTMNPVYLNLKKIEGIHFQFVSKEVIRKKLERGSVDASICIVENAGQGRIVNLATSAVSQEKANLFRMLLSQIIDKQTLAQAGVQHSIAEIRETKVEGREYKTIDFILPGQLGFSILSAGVFGTAFVFISLRQTLVIKRFFATPVRKVNIVIGEALSRLVFSVIGSLIIILIGHFAFGFTLIHGAATVLQMLVLAVMGLIVFMGFGFVVSGIAKNETAVPPIANIITLPQFLLAGTFFSISSFPEWLQPVCKVLPLTYLNDALRKVAFDGANLGSLGTELMVISAWGVVVYAAAVRFFKWE